MTHSALSLMLETKIEGLTARVAPARIAPTTPGFSTHLALPTAPDPSPRTLARPGLAIEGAVPAEPATLSAEDVNIVVTGPGALPPGDDRLPPTHEIVTGQSVTVALDKAAPQRMPEVPHLGRPVDVPRAPLPVPPVSTSAPAAPATGEMPLPAPEAKSVSPTPIPAAPARAAVPHLQPSPTQVTAEPPATMASLPVQGDLPVDARPSPTPAPPAEPTQVVRQVIEQVKVHQGERSIDIRLDPPQLGRVQIELEFGREGAVRAIVSAAEPETTQLLRRNVAMLARELSDTGLGDVSIDFTDERPTDQERRFDKLAVFVPAPIAASAAEPIAPTVRYHTDGLDLRL
jgi:hypothetical protein